MMDREKVIKVLNDALKAKENYPWAKAEMSFEFIEMLIELLKEQEAMLVEYSAFGGMKYGGCPRCNARIDNLVNPKACGFCGQEVKWE